MHIWWTDEQDLATAYLAAISVEHEGFDAFFIAGDHEQKEINLSKAKRPARLGTLDAYTCVNLTKTLLHDTI